MEPLHLTLDPERERLVGHEEEVFKRDARRNKGLDGLTCRGKEPWHLGW